MKPQFSVNGISSAKCHASSLGCPAHSHSAANTEQGRRESHALRVSVLLGQIQVLQWVECHLNTNSKDELSSQDNFTIWMFSYVFLR